MASKICLRCGRPLKEELNYYTFKDGSRDTICKKCITAKLDLLNPESYLPLMQHYDVPYVESVWKNECQKEYEKAKKDAKKKHPSDWEQYVSMRRTPVFGKYLGDMKLNQWKKYHWEDTDALREQYQQLIAAQGGPDLAAAKALKEAAQKDLESGAITEEQYTSYVAGDFDYAQELEREKTAPPQEIYEYENRLGDGSGFIDEDKIPDPGESLTEEDKLYLAMKWGRLYKPAEWIALEKTYSDFTGSFSVKDPSRKDYLKKICKTSLKMDNAIDCDDYDGFQKLSRVYDSLMKSAKFTEAQKKDSKEGNFSSVGQIVRFAESKKGGGRIPRHKIDTPLDQVDETYKRLEAYPRTLFLNDPGMQQQFENYIKRRENARLAEQAQQEAREQGLDSYVLKDEDFIEDKELVAQQKKQDEEYIHKETKKKLTNLSALLKFSEDKDVGQIEVTEEVLLEYIDEIRELIAFYREYPDLFIDDIKGPDCAFEFRFTQRIFLRAVMRHKYVYAVFPRGFSKSFLSMMALMLKAVLFPGSKLSITTGGKEQAASITISKIEEICKLIPALDNELNHERGKTKNSKDNVHYLFKCGSEIDILAAKDSSRGQRRTGILIEESILVDGDALNEIIIPTTNVDRNLEDGTTDPDEVVNQSLIYITTAGWKGTFPYDKLVEVFVRSVFEPEDYMILGGNYELSIIEGAAKKSWLEDLKLSGSYNESSFDREYNSIWSGDAENAYFSSDLFDKNRKLLQPESQYSARSARSAYYVLGVDVGRTNCPTEVVVIKSTPQVQGSDLKSIVNLYSIEGTDFEEQAIQLKKLFYKYKARTMVVDANGLGVGLVDFLIKAQIDPETGDILPPFGVGGATTDDIKNQPSYRAVNKASGIERDALYLVKATAPINTEAHAYVQTQLSSGKIKFLIDERDASLSLDSTKVGSSMSVQERAERLRPFQLTSILKEQMMNLIQSNEGVNIILKQNNSRINKDKFSALEYGLYYIRKEEEKKKKKKTSSINDLMFFSGKLGI